MITVNGPFILALAIIIFLIVIKWIEWYLFQNGSFHFEKQASAITARTADAAEEQGSYQADENRIKTFFIQFKSILFFGKADLRRPWYVGLPFAVFIILQHTVFDIEKLELYQVIFFGTLSLMLFWYLDTLLMIWANRGFFSERDRKKRYIKSQIAQIGLACMIFVIAMSTMLIDYERKYADPPGLKESVDWVIEPTFEAEKA